MLNKNFFELVKIIKKEDDSSISYCCAKPYKNLVNLILKLMKHFPAAFDKINVKDMTVADALAISENILEKLSKKTKNSSIIYSFVYNNHLQFSLHEIMIVYLILHGTKKKKLFDIRFYNREDMLCLFDSKNINLSSNFEKKINNINKINLFDNIFSLDIFDNYKKNLNVISIRKNRF